MYIYLIRNKVTGKVYVGQTQKTVECRISGHIRESRYNRRNYPLYSSIKKYGWDNFEYEVLCECQTIDELNQAEIMYIKQYDACNIEHGYNLSEGGEGRLGIKWNDTQREKHRERMLTNHPTKGKPHPRRGKTMHTEEHKKKVSERMKGENSPHWGKRLSEERRKEISERLKGHTMSDRTRQALRDANVGRKMSLESIEKGRQKKIGKKHTEEHKRKIGEAGRGRKHSDETKQKISESRTGENNPFYGKTHTIESRVRTNGYIWVATKEGHVEYFAVLTEWCKAKGFTYRPGLIKRTGQYKGYALNKVDLADVPDDVFWLVVSDSK